MSRRHLPFRLARPSLPFALMLLLLSLLLLAGGASRADALGQSVVRGAACLVMAGAALFAERQDTGSARPVLYLLIGMLGLVLAQLVPLPPAVWQSLPARAIFAEAAASGEQPWRPWSIVPDMTINAAASLLIPLAVLLLAITMKRTEHYYLPGSTLVLISISMLIGLVQFSGVRIDSPFVNDSQEMISGLFANRNHFALFLALGCLIAPVWAFQEDRRAPWRCLAALGLVVLFLLVILASGSRAGTFSGLLALCLGLFIVRGETKRVLRSAPRWAFPLLIVTVFATVALLGLISFSANRAESIRRAVQLDTALDMRVLGMPTVLKMVATYFPAGTGFGSFDPLFRIHEPFALLKPTYFNHAHNDFLEIVLDGGLPALLLLLAALAWWLFASVRVWRGAASPRRVMGRLGSAMLFLVFLSSVVDYPARTPMMMAMVVLAAVWLSWGSDASARSALPAQAYGL